MNQTEINELKTFLVKIHTHLTDINTAWIASLDNFIKEKESELALEPKEKTTSKATSKQKKVKPAKKE